MPFDRRPVAPDKLRPRRHVFDIRRQAVGASGANDAAGPERQPTSEHESRFPISNVGRRPQRGRERPIVALGVMSARARRSGATAHSDRAPRADAWAAVIPGLPTGARGTELQRCVSSTKGSLRSSAGSLNGSNLRPQMA